MKPTGKAGSIAGRSTRRGTVSIAAAVLPKFLKRIDQMAERDQRSRSFVAGLLIEAGVEALKLKEEK